MDLETSHILIRIIEIVWVDLLLSGDNAVLLAVATRALPQSQRRTGVMLGSIAFMLLRLVLAFALLAVAPMPGFGLIGAALLVWTAATLGGRAEAKSGLPAGPLRNVVAVLAACLLADATPALQNMLAVNAAAQGARPLVMLGLALSFPMLALGGSPLIGQLRRPPALWAGVALLGWLAGQLAATDTALRGLLLPVGLLDNFAPPVLAVLAILLAYGFLRGRKLKGAPQR